MKPMGRDVVIVGAGVAGTSVFVQLIRALARADGPRVRSVRLVDPRPVGWGVAFGDSDPLLLCNSAAEVNSLLADRLDDFVDYLRQRHGWTGTPQDCVPRARMAEYCHDRWAEARRTATALGVGTEHVRAAAAAIGTGPDGRRLVRLEGPAGRELPADAVVVCTGVHRPRVPDGFAALTAHPRYLDSPYPAGRLRDGVRPGSRVLVLGTRQSAVDAALLLGRDGHHVTMTSPSGLLPAVRLSLGAPPHPLPPVERIASLDPHDPALEDKVLRHVVEGVRLLSDRPLRRQASTAADPVERLREETALVDAGVCAWPGVVVAALEAVIELGAVLPAGRRHALMRRFAWFTDRYATAMTVVNAHRLLALFDTGALRVAGSYPRAVSAADDDGWRITWPGAGEPERFGLVVNATGFLPPELYRSPDGQTLHLSGGVTPSGATAVDHLEADLRVRARPGAPPEPVWVAGVGTHVRIPFSNHLRNVARQARRVAEEVAGPADGEPGGSQGQ
ncbi:FAD/NAD(P)-binding protein [Streptomyces sp. NPDC053048]|uniref:FAD/NAD(P)-binding protein n=1 Tax=Streptomyces sp. NPDC053048 TaxID=3365694 RepID=UPI0037D65D9F